MLAPFPLSASGQERTERSTSAADNAQKKKTKATEARQNSRLRAGCEEQQRSAAATAGNVSLGCAENVPDGLTGFVLQETNPARKKGPGLDSRCSANPDLKMAGRTVDRTDRTPSSQIGIQPRSHRSAANQMTPRTICHSRFLIFGL